MNQCPARIRYWSPLQIPELGCMTSGTSVLYVNTGKLNILNAVHISWHIDPNIITWIKKRSYSNTRFVRQTVCLCDTNVIFLAAIKDRRLLFFCLDSPLLNLNFLSVGFYNFLVCNFLIKKKLNFHTQLRICFTNNISRLASLLFFILYIIHMCSLFMNLLSC